jgi:hypothetical protein
MRWQGDRTVLPSVEILEIMGIDDAEQSGDYSNNSDGMYDKASFGPFVPKGIFFVVACFPIKESRQQGRTETQNNKDLSEVANK